MPVFTKLDVVVGANRQLVLLHQGLEKLNQSIQPSLTWIGIFVVLVRVTDEDSLREVRLSCFNLDRSCRCKGFSRAESVQLDQLCGNVALMACQLTLDCGSTE